MTGDGDQRFAHPVVPVLLGIIVVAGGGYLYYSGMQATANAEEVDATVLSSTVVDHDDAANSESADEYTVSVEYRYTYDGETYTSRDLCPGVGSGCEPTSDFRTDMQEFLDDYPEGDTVTAYVPPSNPSDAYLLETGPSQVYLLVAGFGLFILLLGVRRLVAGE